MVGEGPIMLVGCVPSGDKEDEGGNGTGPGSSVPQSRSMLKEAAGGAPGRQVAGWC